MRGVDAGCNAAIERCVEYHKRGERYKWAACLAAADVVGRYEEGATRYLAKRMALSVSQVENYARAGVTWRILRRFGLRSATRNALTFSHFAAMGELMRWYDLPMDEAIEALELAAEEGASVMQMKYLIRESHGHYRPWLERYRSLTKNLDDLIWDYETPQPIRLVLRAALRRLRSVV